MKSKGRYAPTRYFLLRFSSRALPTQILFATTLRARALPLRQNSMRAAHSLRTSLCIPGRPLRSAGAGQLLAGQWYSERFWFWSRRAMTFSCQGEMPYLVSHVMEPPLNSLCTHQAYVTPSGIESIWKTTPT